MNAIVGLCHFCEAHGPRPIFCTFTTDKEEHTTDPSKSAVQCNGCTSLGPETVLVSKGDDGTIFCSRESVPNADVTAFLRQAAIRSITCEVSWSKEGGVVYFSDSHGHVLSSTFQLRDTRARGLQRWFSIVVLMKDRMLLLSISTLLAEHMKQVARELQQLAGAVFHAEQQVCSQRALRLNTGRNDFGQSRSLIQLTGEEAVFKRLHAWFAWMLQAGARRYCETLHCSPQLLNKLHPDATRGSIFEPGACSVPEEDACMPLRALESLISKETFRALLYCTLTGIHISVQTSYRDPSTIMDGLARLVPLLDQSAPHVGSSAPEHPSHACQLTETDNNQFCLKWSGTIPARCPTLMNRIESAMSNDKFKDAALHQHVKSLQMEWLGMARSVKAAAAASGASSDAVRKLKQALGAAPHDDTLLHYWMNSFC